MIRAGKSIADAADHEFDFLPLDEFALGFGGAAFCVGAVVGEIAQGCGVGLAMVEEGAQETVDQEVRIAADGRGEVGVGIGRKREVADVPVL